MEILERNFQDLIKEEEKKYKCYTCKFYKVVETSFGVLEKCNYKKEERNKASKFLKTRVFYKREEYFEVKKVCKNYEKGVMNNESGKV